MTEWQLMLPIGRQKSSLHKLSCTFGMMPAAFGPVIPATSRVTVMLVYAEETPSDFAREVPEGTRYVVKSVAAQPPFPGTFSCHLV